MICLCFQGIHAQLTVSLEDQCNCEVLRGTLVSAPGTTNPIGADLGDLNVNTTNGLIFFWDGDSWELTGADQDPNNEIELPTGGTAGQLLQTDGSGNYSWGDDSDRQTLSLSNTNLTITGGNSVNLSSLSTFGDNLGNHRATQDLEMRNNDILMSNSGNINFTSRGQRINLSNQAFGIGVQAGTQYYRSSDHFAWFRRGAHSNTAFDAGAGGVALMALRSNGRLGLGTTSPRQRLDVEGNIALNNDLYLNDKLALRGNDDWLRLNQSGQFGNGVYTRYNLRVDGQIMAGTGPRQIINFLGFDGRYGIGIQNSTQYFRTGGNFTWFRNGIHSNTALDPGTGGTALMTLRGSGRLGLGTTAPTQLLDVEGNIALNDFLYMNDKLAIRGNDDWLRLNQNRQFANGIYSPGNARLDGILQLGNNARAQLINLFNGSGVYGIGVQTNTQYFRTNNSFAWFRRGTHSDAALDPGAGGTALMILNSSGRLGLGTTAPTQRLDVEGNIALNDYLYMNDKIALRANDDWLRLNQNQQFVNGVCTPGNVRFDGITRLGTARSQMLNLGYDNGRYGIGVQSATQYFRTDGNFAWFRRGIHSDTAFDPGAGGTALMALRSNGRLGIGTDTPTQSLDVEGNIALNDILYMNDKLAIRGNDDWLRLNQNGQFINGIYSPGNARLDGILQLGNNDRGQLINLFNGTGIYGIGVQTNTQYFRTNNSFAWFRRGTHSDTALDPGAGGSAQMVLNSSGNLGIGTTSPEGRLHVNGNIIVSGAATAVANQTGLLRSGNELVPFDAAGNQTVISPHNFSGIPNGPSEEMAWAFYSQRNGLQINVDMARAIRLVEALSGEQLIFLKGTNQDHRFGVASPPKLLQELKQLKEENNTMRAELEAQRALLEKMADQLSALTKTKD
ncbi:MAG: hypothetical protein AAGI38_06280 [Bacteroidota bacterium]